VFFQSNLFHPRVHEVTGELDISKYYAAWSPETDRLWHVLKYVHRMFGAIDADNAVNEGAAAV
jgi:ubiquitin-protein ligase